MTYTEIIKKLSELEIDPRHLGYEDYDDVELQKELGTMDEVECVGGYEDRGDYATRVYHFVDHNVYVRITGFYSSYAGTEWDESFSEVKPVEKKVVVFE